MLIDEVGISLENLVFIRTLYLGYYALVAQEDDAVVSYNHALHNLIRNKEGDFKLYTLQNIAPQRIVAIAKKAINN